MSGIAGSRRRQALFAVIWLTVLAMVATSGAAATAASSTSELDLAPDGQQANGPPSAVVVAAGGRYVAFASTAANLVAGDTNHASDVFVRDVQTGNTERVSVTSAGGQADGPSYGPLAISADGRYVAFQSDAPNMETPGSGEEFTLVIRDRLTGTTSTAPHEQLPNSIAMSADGRYLAYEEWQDRVVRLDLTTGSIILVGYGDTAWPSGISDDGAKVLWSSQDDLNLHLWNAATHTDQIVNRSRDGKIVGGAGNGGVLSGDGRYVLFTQPGKTAHGRVEDSVYIRDVALGSTNRIDITTAGVPLSGYAVAISDHGRYRFFCAPSHLRREVGMQDLFVRDGHTRTAQRVAPFGSPGGFSFCDAAITANARYLAWISSANWLVPYDQNGLPGVFWRGPLN